MFQRILVPVDLTGKNRIAVRAAAQLRQENGSSVTLLHVIETIEHVPFEEIEPFYSKIERDIKSRMEELIGEFGGDAAGIEQRIVYGDRVGEILDFASEEDTDLIVMASRKIDPARPREGWSTICFKVAFLSSCPVLLVK